MNYTAAQHGWVTKPVSSKKVCSTTTHKVKHTSGKKRHTYYSKSKTKTCHMVNSAQTHRVYTTTAQAKYRLQLKNGKWYCVTAATYAVAGRRKPTTFVPTGYGRFC